MSPLIDGVAANPAAPAEILLRLLDARRLDPTSRALPDEVVNATLERAPTLWRLKLAANPHISTAQRTRVLETLGIITRDDLLTSDEIRQEAARHLWSHPVIRSFWNHPEPQLRIWSCAYWGMLSEQERAALIADSDEGVRACAVMSRKYQTRLVTVADLEPRGGHQPWVALINNLLSRELVDDILQRMTDQPHGEADAECIAANPSTPPDAVAVLATHPGPGVRRALARRHDLPLAILLDLADDPDQQVRNAVSTHHHLTEDQRLTIDYRFPDAEDGDFGPMPNVWPPRDMDWLIRKATSAHTMLRRSAASNAWLPPEYVPALADDHDLGVRALLSHNHPEAPPEVLLRTFTECPRNRWRLTAQQNFPRDGLTRFAGHESPVSRRLATHDPTMDAATADRLTRDGDSEVREAASRHANLSLSRILELIAGSDPAPAEAAAANPSLPVEEMGRILADHLDSSQNPQR